MLKRDTASVLQCIKAARACRDGRSALCLIVEQVLLIEKFKPETSIQLSTHNLLFFLII
jgi:hypothetical protein